MFINNYAGDRRVSIPLDNARRWGLVEDQRVQIAQATTSDEQRFCLRFIFNAEKVAPKHDPTRNRRFIQALINDTAFHVKHLQTVEGLLVPRNYGMWKMHTGNWAGTVLFSLTQWCGTPWQSLVGTRLDTRANRLLIARTCEALHDLGVKINGVMGNAVDLCHIILDLDDPNLTEEMAEAGQARCYVVDFSRATQHKCKRSLPLVPLGNGAFKLLMQTLELNFGCRELKNLAYLLELMPIAGLQYAFEPPETPIKEAIKWHDDYFAAHPSYSNAAVLVAQRVTLFPNALPVYPSLEVSGVSKENVHEEITLFDRGRGFIHPADLIKHCSRDEYEYLLWGDKMEAKPVALNSEYPRQRLSESSDGIISDPDY
ncbi:hypothetical protein MIND_01172000 [Mycena indigotica]|uniref:Uncharacterized protein n=1 Tax=Mycena indigotica TaxID=2126181 RepID=A0A8H6S6J9_9AGAR|nr:uncharacterized protein MIND_01172000 [Mycena indigotica]KAF7292737.1 hypothetical protein MIND_01172000 [Mycena indigotica]